MAILNLKSKNPDRGYGLLRAAALGDPFWSIVNQDGLDHLIEESILASLNEAREIGDPFIATIEQAIEVDPQVQLILDALYEIGATNQCSVAEMMIHRPIVINPLDGAELIRADFLIDLDDYKTGLYYTGPHTATDWEISKYENMTLPDFTSYNDRSNLTNILTEALDENTFYFIRAKFQSDQMNSLWSEKVLVHTGFVRSFLARTAPMSLFCNTIVDIRATLVGGKGSDHTLEWEQITDQPITWIFGETGSLAGRYEVTNFEDVFWWLIVDRGTLYETRFRLNVYRGGIEFPNFTHKLRDTRAESATVPQLHVVKDFVEGVANYTKDQDNLFLFWENPNNYSMKLMKWSPSLYEWVVILDSPTILHFPITNGMYKVVIYDLTAEIDVESKVYEILDDPSLHFNNFYNNIHKLSISDYTDLDILKLTVIGKEFYDSTAKTPKLYHDSTLTGLTVILLTSISMDAGYETVARHIKLYKNNAVTDLTVVLLENTQIG